MQKIHHIKSFKSFGELFSNYYKLFRDFYEVLWIILSTINDYELFIIYYKLFFNFFNLVSNYFKRFCLFGNYNMFSTYCIQKVVFKVFMISCFYMKF